MCARIQTAPSASPVLQDVMQQGGHGHALSRGLLIQEAPGAVLADHKLLRQTSVSTRNLSAH